ncbi:dual specificity tyrosine-phosphorylation-regulated kinase 4-like [Solea senegalensis]|uniref:Dual specificity tyrosine-phosphorylation-regulated kinase 4-like n=1 Tax=Solea senegalensis TaxID=28829 RepID=A0AAV6QC04_SOLSE|nr:dual specificity tyrosine-phosphorylation-regulated kinase 4-like [Solea senegalensis]
METSPTLHNYMIINDHLAYRFQILTELGVGASGQVFKCKDHKTNEFIAVKIIRNKESIHRLGKGEVTILKALRRSGQSNKANIVQMKEYFYFRSHLCITFELMEKDLFEAMENALDNRFSEKGQRKYTIDILNGLLLLRNKRIVHSDIKPENIFLFKKDGEMHAAVGDFGGSYFLEDTDPEFTFTPMYASPEVLLGKSCSPATDMWSLGCIIAELHLGYPLFCGSNSEQQFIRIMQVLGPPPKELLVNAPKKKNYFDCKGVPLRMESVMRYRTSLTRHLASTNYHFVDFIRRCLEYDPQRRMTPEEAMHHPWILQGVNNNKSARRTDVPASASYTRPALLRRKKLSHQQLQPVVEVEARTFHKPYHNVFQHNSLLVDCY